jgi:hypothetical protein
VALVFLFSLLEAVAVLQALPLACLHLALREGMQLQEVQQRFLTRH